MENVSLIFACYYNCDYVNKPLLKRSIAQLYVKGLRNFTENMSGLDLFFIYADARMVQSSSLLELYILDKIAQP